jgi:D-tyrosyl-tRNA(Tyr) deacylase
MRLVVQRVKEAEVKVDGRSIGKIGKGLLVLLGIHVEDQPETTARYVNKLVNLRIFEDENGKMNRSVKDVGGEILVVSQFTLYGNCSKGRRPSFIEAAQPDLAIPLYEKFIHEVEKEMGSVQTGEFGASMAVSLINEGPVTIVIENLNNC